MCPRKQRRENVVPYRVVRNVSSARVKLNGSGWKETSNPSNLHRDRDHHHTVLLEVMPHDDIEARGSNQVQSLLLWSELEASHQARLGREMNNKIRILPSERCLHRLIQTSNQSV